MTPELQEANTKVSNARSRIMLDRSLAFWSGLMIQIPWKVVPSTQDNAPKSAYATAKEVVFNADFINSLSTKEVGFVILHELSHILRQDLWRVGDRTAQRWNVASDLFINESICNLSSCSPVYKGGNRSNTAVKAPLDALYFSTYKDGIYKKYIHKDTEALYNALPEDVGPSPTDELRKSTSEEASQESRQAEEAELRRIVLTAKNIAEQANKRALEEAGCWVRDFVEQLLLPKVDWKLVLQDFMLSTAVQDWKWHRPYTPMFVTTGGIMPSLQATPSVSAVVVLLDSSSSVSDVQLAQAWGEIKSMAHTVDALHVAHFTTTIAKITTYDSLPEDITPTERFEGDTAIDKVVNDLSEKLIANDVKADVVIVLSDMYSELPKEPVGFPPTLWVNLASENTTFKAPFGVQLTIE